MLSRSIFFGIFFLFIASCSNSNNSKKDNTILQQAGQIHLEAVKIDEKIQPTLTKVTSVKQQLEQKTIELTLEEKGFLQEVIELERSYAFWEENHVEVPGFEHEGHDHHDHSHHDHNHGPSLDVSAEDMLLIQQEFKDSLSSIAARLEKLNIPDSLTIQ